VDFDQSTRVLKVNCDKKILALDEYYSNKLKEDFAYDGNSYPSNLEFKTDLVSIILGGQHYEDKPENAAGSYSKTITNILRVRVAFTLDQASELNLLMTENIESINDDREFHSNAINNLTVVQDVLDYDFS